MTKSKNKNIKLQLVTRSKYHPCLRIFLAFIYIFGLISGVVPLQIFAQTQDIDSQTGSEQVVEYNAGYFGRFQPNNALDMVKQVPGFVLDDVNNNRGYGASAGNVLIDGRRPSSKEDSLSALLSRIPASQVERIELIRGQVRGVDLRGHSVVANIILVTNSTTVVRWETGVRRNTLVDRLLLRGNASLSDQWNGIEFNLGASVDRSSTGEHSPENVFNGDNQLIERRLDNSVERGIKSNFNINASSLVGETLFQLNSKLSINTEEEPKDSVRTPLIIGVEPRTEKFFDDRKDTEFEIGLNAERTITSDLFGKSIFLYNLEDDSEVSSQTRFNRADEQTFFRISDNNSRAQEAIGRVELVWTGMENHAIQLNLEGAFNSLDNNLFETEDDGAGPVEVVVPGSNTKVKEYRGDFLLRDTWAIEQLELDYGLGAEVSTIKQSGDAVLDRNFFYLKPYGLLTWLPKQDMQFQGRIAREVSQLDFEDFVSASNFQDDDLALGNPNLRPDTTWILEASHERRFNQDTVAKLTVFHHWISDVLDLLPITDTFEAPGNIGDGMRWGLILETTLPLEWTGLIGAKLDVKARWQDSTVVDPVIGEDRVLSGRKGFGGNPYISFNDENRYALILDYRQDFQEARVAWGMNIGTRSKRTVFNVNETDIYDEGIALNAFIETTRWLGLKLTLIGENLTNLSQVRERIIYTGERGLSPVNITEVSEELEGVRITLSMSGSF